MCVFWAICAVVWLVLGSLHIDRFNNATAINSDFNYIDSYYQSHNNSTEEDQGNYKHEAYLMQAGLAYDSCQIPYYKLDPKITQEAYINTYERLYDECGLDT